MSAEPIGFLVAVEFGPEVRPLFFRDRNDAETYRVNRPTLAMRPLYWGDGDFSLTELTGGDDA